MPKVVSSPKTASTSFPFKKTKHHYHIWHKIYVHQMCKLFIMSVHQSYFLNEKFSWAIFFKCIHLNRSCNYCFQWKSSSEIFLQIHFIFLPFCIFLQQMQTFAADAFLCKSLTFSAVGGCAHTFVVTRRLSFAKTLTELLSILTECLHADLPHCKTVQETTNVQHFYEQYAGIMGCSHI